MLLVSFVIFFGGFASPCSCIFPIAFMFQIAAHNLWNINSFQPEMCPHGLNFIFY